MMQRSVGTGIFLAAALALAGCGHPEQRVVDQYFGAVNAGDNQTLTSFAAVRFDKKVEKWKIVAVSPEATVEAPLPGLAKAFVDAQATYEAEKKQITRLANENYADYQQVNEAEKKGTKVPANLQDMHDKLEAWKKRDRELKQLIMSSKAAADAERRIAQLSMGSNVEGIDSVPADMASKDVELLLTVAGQPEAWVMHLKKYTPKESSGQRVISRWAIAGLDPKK